MKGASVFLLVVLVAAAAAFVLPPQGRDVCDPLDCITTPGADAFAIGDTLAVGAACAVGTISRGQCSAAFVGSDFSQNIPPDAAAVSLTGGVLTCTWTFARAIAADTFTFSACPCCNQS